MRLDVNKLSSAVRLAISLGAVAAAGTITAQAQTAGATDQQKSQALETIVVTGSNIRRVDVETANPVITIDKAKIQQSGKLTLGDLVQNLPSIAGSPTNPNVNNGGGAGASVLSLRGLGSARSLLLINGHRVPVQLQDLNMIPISAVERIEILADGASAVYGSDAIAGVVNIITNKTYQGAEFGADYGISDRDDGERKSGHLMFGHTTDKGSLLVGINYNKQDEISAANRKYSHDALYRYNTGYVLHGGSSRTPNGRIFLTGDIKGHYGCGSITLKQAGPPPAGGTNSLDDYRCYNGSTDAFNYQAVGNRVLTPSERTGLFTLGNYKLTDNVETFVEVFHNKTVSSAQIAPVPVDMLNDGTYIPADNYYNIFGIPFGIDPVTHQPTNGLRTRLTQLGNRSNHFATTHDMATFGLKGSLFDNAWNWNVWGQYAKLSTTLEQVNFINYTKLIPNFNCSTAPGAGDCIPFDMFNLNDPNTIALLKNAAINPTVHLMFQYKAAGADVNGSVFDLPAGSIQVAAGLSYNKQYQNTTVDPVITTQLLPGPSLVCDGPGSICAAPTRGGFNVKDAYAELLVPILKDQPFAYSLNLDIGDRYSKYSNFGSTNNWKIALEYKPIEDMLLRGTASKVFRAPTIADLFNGPATDSPTAHDPCGSEAVKNNPACQGYTFTNTGTSQINAIVTGSVYGNQHLGTNINLQPENGKSYDYGFVYDPHWVPGLSLNADYYRIVLDNLIVSGVGIAQTILDKCFSSGLLCDAIIRNSSGSDIGQLRYVYEVSFNSGQLTTKGVDIGGNYRLPEFSWLPGSFRVGLQTTYISKYDVVTNQFAVQHLAGHYDRTYGNIARWHALGTLDWNWGPWSANWTSRYIGKARIGYYLPPCQFDASIGGCAPGTGTGGGPSASADGAYSPAGASVYNYPSYTYHNLSVGYNIEPINTQVQIGIDNVSDKQPPIFYQQNVINANTDVATYDTAGRFYWAKVTVKF
jgi:outer membrane receptor protein involved in Fe transport